jgi:hypothetical protein
LKVYSEIGLGVLGRLLAALADQARVIDTGFRRERFVPGSGDLENPVVSIIEQVEQFSDLPESDFFRLLTD